MRISDWSSDVCSSDLIPARPVTVGVFGAVPSPASFAYRDGALIGDFVKTAGGIQKIGDKSEIFVVRANGTVLAGEIGRASGRERGCQYESISGVAGPSKHNTIAPDHTPSKEQQ